MITSIAVRIAVAIAFGLLVPGAGLGMGDAPTATIIVKRRVERRILMNVD